MGEEKQENARLNYRISFDAMRAYHTSEIEHTKNIITILNNMLIALGSVYAGLFYYVLMYQKFNFCIAFFTNHGMLFILTGTVLHLCDVSQKKIEKENIRYESFREECIAMREILGLNEHNKKYWEKNVAERKESGYKRTIAIIESYKYIIFILLIFTYLIAHCLSISRFISECSK